MHVIIGFLYDRDRQCEQQNGSLDCGLFALTFASILASGSHPSAYHFKQRLLQQHLITWLCLNQNRFEQFPIARHGRVNKKAIKYIYSIAIYSHYRMPEAFKKNMIKCDRCS